MLACRFPKAWRQVAHFKDFKDGPVTALIPIIFDSSLS